MSSVAAIVPSWNTASHIGRCLDALAAQEGVTVETLVVDNGSKDLSLQIIESRGVGHLVLPTNIGFARAVNRGVGMTSAPLVLVLNADCFLSPDCLRLLVAALSADDRLGGVQPQIVQDETSDGCVRIYSAGQCLTRDGRAYERGWGEPVGSHYGMPEEIFGVSGAACLLRRELFTDLGGYDESYFAFFEDVDLNARARLGGWTFAYVPDAIATHVGHAGWRQQVEPQRFNVELTVRNRLATALKVLPAGGVFGSAVLTLRTLAASPFRRTSRAALAGTLTALRWLPRLLSERRRLRRGTAHLLDPWLSRGAGPGPDPGAD